MTTLLLLCLAVIPWASCGTPQEVAPAEFLWSEESAWHATREGWVHGVLLDVPRSLPAAAAGSPRHFRAVAWSADGSGILKIEKKGAPASLKSLDEPAYVDVDLEDGVSLSAEGEVVVSWARRVDPRRQGRRKVLAIADTLRFDHARPELMPGVSEYFAEGRHYTQAYSAASWTLPSMAALFTGQAPSHLRHPDGTLIAVPEHQVTLASKLRRQGYATVGITANYTIHHENGYSAGFDSFLAPTPKEGAGQFRDAQWVARWARDHSRWLQDLDLFLYLQFMDPHDPYRDHESGGEWKAPQTGHVPSPEEVRDLRRAYASEVRYLDRHLAPLLRDLDGDSVVFTSDHGEEFFDHGGFRHGPALYPESIHVPLWIRDRGLAGGEYDTPVSLIDLHHWLAGDVAALEDVGTAVTAESFSFGPPRWSWVDGTRQWILFAREMEGLEGSAEVPSDGQSQVARWLLEHHPHVQAKALSEEALAPSDPPSPPSSSAAEGGGRRVPKELFEHFEGFRRGLFVRAPRGVSLNLELRGIDGQGWAWGSGEAQLAAADDGNWSLTAQGDEPFLLIFLASSSPLRPELMDPQSEELLKLDEQAYESADGLRIWFDVGRPPDSLRSTGETLERLKSLGYI